MVTLNVWKGYKELSKPNKRLSKPTRKKIIKPPKKVVRPKNGSSKIIKPPRKVVRPKNRFHTTKPKRRNPTYTTKISRSKKIITKSGANTNLHKCFQTSKKFNGTNVLNTQCDYIIGYRDDPKDNHRLNNLIILLSWLKRWIKFTKSMTIYIVEQDSKKHLDKQINLKNYHPLNIKYIFLYNPKEFNRGWLYNCCIRNHCQNKTIVLADVDLIFSKQLFDLIHESNQGLYNFISPYNKIWYTDLKEKKIFERTMNLKVPKKVISKAVTFTGGMLIINKDRYLELGGFEEFQGYGYEDRAFDIMIDNLEPFDKIKVNCDTYVHLYHPPEIKAKVNLNIGKYFSKIYCPVTNYDNNYVHLKCRYHNNSFMKVYLQLKKDIHILGKSNFYKDKETNQLFKDAKTIYGKIIQQI